jgi:hypothetical protein
MKKQKEELKKENNKLKKVIKQQKEMIEILSNEKIVISLKKSIEDFKYGRYKVLEEDKSTRIPTRRKTTRRRIRR